MRNVPVHQDVAIHNLTFPVEIYPMNTRKEGLIIHNHWHEHVEFLYFRIGNACVKSDSTSITAWPGDLVIINSNEVHSIINIGDELDYYVLLIHPSIMNGNSEIVTASGNTSYRKGNRFLFNSKIENDKQVEKHMDNVINEYNLKSNGYELALKSHVYGFLAYLIRNAVKETVDEKKYEERLSVPMDFYHILKYIENHYTENLSLSMISKMANLNSSYFCRVFKAITGKTFHEHVNTLRLDKAQALLESSDMNITEISSYIGYSDANYFSRIYKRYKRLPPSAVKKKNNYPKT